MSDAPPKFITENGVKKLNPEFKKWKAIQDGSAATSTGGASAPPAIIVPTMKNEAVALPIVCNVQEFNGLGQGVQMNAAYQQAQAQYLQASQQVGLPQESMLDQLGRVFAKYEIPMGMLGKLGMLTEFQVAEILIDDSGSMSSGTDSKHPNGKQMTRWEEAKKNLTLMIEIFAYVPSPPMSVRFLNRSDEILLQKNPGENPEQFLHRANSAINQVFSRGPSGTTPYKERAQQSLARFPGQAVLRYWFNDGVPNGGDDAVEDIVKMVKNRPNPQKNPITLVACTNNDEDVAWMEKVEEESSWVSQSDDFGDESGEVLKDQGAAFPYSFGLWLMSLIVGAVCPDDLDAMDESSPLPKATLSELSGYELSAQDYDYYLNAFFDAQRKKPAPSDAGDKIKAEYAKKFEAIRDEFHKARNLSSIPLVQEYRKKMLEVSKKGDSCVIA